MVKKAQRVSDGLGLGNDPVRPLDRPRQGHRARVLFCALATLAILATAWPCLKSTMPSRKLCRPTSRYRRRYSARGRGCGCCKWNDSC